MAIALAVALEMPGEAVVWLCRSVAVHPPNGNIDFLRMIETILTSSIWSCTLAVRLSFPFMAAAILAHATLGVLNRAIPQLNITNVGFSISLLAGGVTLYWAAPSVAEIAAKAALSIFSRG
jgi:flagellar biosynthetic protein FliR